MSRHSIRNGPLTAWRGKRVALAVASISIAAITAWAIRHVIYVWAVLNGRNESGYVWVFLFTFAMLAWQLSLCFFERPFKGGFNNHDHVTVLVPVYNEDPAGLRACLVSMIKQTRQPNEIHVTDDGSTSSDYAGIRDWFMDAALEAGIYPSWVRTDNKGKRHAQAVGVRNSPESTVYVTVDSDAILDARALEEGLKPFEKRRVQSVAGIVLATNNRKNLLARLTDLWFVSGQLVDRSSMSAARSVLVNSGSLALYRAPILQNNLVGYLNETFFGRHVPFSDDSLLTLYSRLRGDTVQQPTAFSFSMMPERLSHHFRQQLRWMRGSFIRSWWRAKYLPLTGYAYWIHFFRWTQFAVSSSVFLVLFIYQPLTDHTLVPALVLIPILVGYGQSLRYLAVRRSDEAGWSQLLTFALSPITSLWVYLVLRPLRWYAIATCWRTGWGTRESVEVSLDRTQFPAVAA